MLRNLIKRLIKAVTPYGIITSYLSSKTKKEVLSTALKSPPLSNKENRFIITLTSYGKRVKSTAPYTICSLLNQTILADRIILWLAEGTPIPPLLKKLVKKGLEIEYCKDLKSYKKLIPALKKYPDAVLITADDDVYYPENWFEQLKNAYNMDKTKIYAHRIHEIALDQHRNILPYRKWRHTVTVIHGGGGHYSLPA
jgi:hypothetical protein